MYPIVITASSHGHRYRYLHLCESSWKNGRSTRRTVVSLGRVDALAPHIDRIYELITGSPPAAPDPDPTPLSCLSVGPFLVLRHLWQLLRLPDALGRHSDRCLLLVLNRLTRPCSEHALGNWLTRFFVCDSQGRRFVPAFRSRQQRLASKSPRVKIRSFQLQRFQRLLDTLQQRQQNLEQHLFQRFRKLFGLRTELVFFDITSTYFQGRGPASVARHGHSRDQRPRNPQVVVGVAMVDGLPLCHALWRGNRRDSTTVQEMVADLQERFELQRFVFVGDRGMKSAANLQALRERGLGYLMAVQGRRNPQMDRALAAAKQEAWEPCQDADGQPKANGSQVQEVTPQGESVRCFLVHSPERKQHERQLRKAARQRTRERLDQLRQRVERGHYLRQARRELRGPQGRRGRSPQEGEPAGEAPSEEQRPAEREARRQAEQARANSLVGEAAGKILSRDHGTRYYAWRVERDGSFRYFASPGFQQEVRREGHWLVQTEEQDLSAVQAVRSYQDLWRVEAAFRTLKDVLEMRPIWHRTESRVRAHVQVAWLALALDRVLQRLLRQQGIGMSTREAWQVLESVNWVEFRLREDDRKVGVATNHPEARRILDALSIKPKAPPAPKTGKTTVH